MVRASGRSLTWPLRAAMPSASSAATLASASSAIVYRRSDSIVTVSYDSVTKSSDRPLAGSRTGRHPLRIADLRSSKAADDQAKQQGRSGRRRRCCRFRSASRFRWPGSAAMPWPWAVPGTDLPTGITPGRDRRWQPRSVSGCRYGGGMTAQPPSAPDPSEPYEVIHLGGEAAAIVPLTDLRRLRAVERRASAEILEEAEIEATIAAHGEWVAAGRPAAASHEEPTAELLGGQ